MAGPLAAVLCALPAAVAAQSAVRDGVAITPEFAQSLYERVASLHEADGCALSRFDTGRFRITIGLRNSAGAEQTFEMSSAVGDARRTAGEWALAVPPALERDCGATLAAIEAVLSRTEVPGGEWFGLGELLVDLTVERGNLLAIAASFVVLVLWTIAILIREVRARQPPPIALLALALVTLAALALRLAVSPRTFLHEYYHIAETISGYLVGQNAPAYGNTGPALFRMVATIAGDPENVQVIFLTNAVIAALAIPAVALLDLAWVRSWPHALCAAVLLCVLPHHLRFSAAEDMLVEAVSFGMWTLALFALYLRTGRLGDALCGGLALAVAVQTRPEMMFFPGVVAALLALAEPGSWRRLFAWRTLTAFAVAAVLLIPRLLELRHALQTGPSPTPHLPGLGRYLSRLVLFDGAVTPAAYWALLAIGAAWTARRQPRLFCWVLLVFVGYTVFSLSLYDNPIFNLRAQILPTSYTVLLAAGAAPVWLRLWGARRQRQALAAGGVLLALLATGIVIGQRHFVTELRDQQLQWAFLERTVPLLPAHGTLLAAVEVGGFKLDAFPDLLLSRAGREYALVDVRRAAAGEVPWPAGDGNLLYYQGMYCYFTAAPEKPAPDPMAPECLAIHQRYVLEPLFVDDLEVEGYSLMPYAPGPFRIGFYRLRQR